MPGLSACATNVTLNGFATVRVTGLCIMIFRLPQRFLGPAALLFRPDRHVFSFVERAAAGTLEDVKARGKLICGVSEGLRGFSEKDAGGAWRGFDVDFCKAVALAVLGDSTKIDYVPLSATDRFNALTGKQIDLLSRNSTWTLTRDAGLGLEFVGVSYFDGQGFMVPALYGATSPLELGRRHDLRGERHHDAGQCRRLFRARPAQGFVPGLRRAAGCAQAYADGKCDAYTADRSALAAERSLLPNPDDHTILRDVISKEPLGPVVRDDDPKWVNVVRWVLFGLIDGEEIGLSSTSVGGDKAAEAAKLGALSGRAARVSPMTGWSRSLAALAIMARSLPAISARIRRCSLAAASMRSGHKAGSCMRRPFNRSDRIRHRASWPACLLSAFVPAPRRPQADVPAAQRNLAAIRINAIDMLAHEPKLPLPIQQRRDVLRAYYAENNGDLLWLKDDRADAPGRAHRGCGV